MPWNAGGETDVVSRALAAAMAPILGQQVIVDNRQGANGAIAAQFVAGTRPDGHTLFGASAEPHSVNPPIYSRLTYNPVADFAPITVFADGPFALVVRTGLGAETIDAFVALARSRPDQLTYASWGIGSTSHLAAARVIQQAGLDLLHAPFTDAAPADAALVGCQVVTCLLFFGPRSAGKLQFRVGLVDGGKRIKKSKFTDAQIGFVLRQAEEGTAIVGEHGVDQVRTTTTSASRKADAVTRLALSSN